MKKILLFATMLLAFSLGYAQIGEVKTEGCYAKIFNEKGKFSGNRIYLTAKSYVAGFNNKFVVVKEGAYVKIFDVKGRFTGKRIYLTSTGQVKNVTTSAILIKEGSYVKYYDFDGRFTGNRTYDPK